MDDRYRVRWTSVAAEDLAAIAEWIARDDPGAALAALDRLEAAAGTLAEAPTRGRSVREVASHGTWLELLVKPWRLVYRVQGADVFVLGVFDTRRDLRDVLFERLVRPTHPR